MSSHKAYKELWITRGVLAALAIFMVFILVETKKESVENKNKIMIVCRSFSSVGNLEVPANLTSTGVAFIVEHRNASILLGCGDLLQPASPILIKKAKQYNIRMEG